MELTEALEILNDTASITKHWPEDMAEAFSLILDAAQRYQEVAEVLQKFSPTVHPLHDLYDA